MNDIKPEIVSETEISMLELKNELESIKKRDTEQSFRFNRTEEYLNSFVTLKPKEGKELIEKLRALDIPRLKDSHIYKIVDILPKTPEELKLIMQNYVITLSNENAKKIVDVVKEYGPKKKGAKPAKEE